MHYIFLIVIIFTQVMPPGGGPFASTGCDTIMKWHDDTSDGSIDRIEMVIEPICNKLLEDKKKEEKDSKEI
jgi:hypothetical protein